MFKRLRGKTKIMYFKADTVREVRDGSLVSITDSGTVVPVRNDSTDRVLGVARRNDTLTEGDSAFMPVEVPVENAVEWEIDVDSDAGAADSDVGRYCAVDTAGGNSVLAGDSCGMRADVSDTGCPQIFITGVISASKIRGTIAKSAWVNTFDSLDTSR